MENLKLTRIDFRLIHGQVMTRWVKKYDIQHIIVIDNKTAKSAILKKIVLNAAPKNLTCEVLSIEEAAERWINGNLSEKKLLILFKDPNSAKEAWQAGVKYEELQIGGIEGSGEKININKNIVMSIEDLNNLKPLHEKGVKIYGQPIPEDSPYPFTSILAKF